MWEISWYQSAKAKNTKGFLVMDHLRKEIIQSSLVSPNSCYVVMCYFTFYWNPTPDLISIVHWVKWSTTKSNTNTKTKHVTVQHKTKRKQKRTDKMRESNLQQWISVQLLYQQAKEASSQLDWEILAFISLP